MRYLYIVLLYMALPYLYARQWWRGRRYPEARARLGERFGLYPFQTKGAIWVHAVSVGETIAALPLIKALQKQYPHHPLVITSMTATGAAYVDAVFGQTVHHVYLCYDYPGACARFLAAIQPVIGIIMETEIWPNLLVACDRAKVPVCLVNARLSEKSAAGYARVASLTRASLQRLAWIAAAAPSDAARFIALGAHPDRVSVSGNIKYDLSIPATLMSEVDAWRDAYGRDVFIWVAASTHEGEESMILAAHEKLRAHLPNALLILVPRHPERFDSIDAMARAHFTTERRSLLAHCSKAAGVYLGDTMGELLFFYAVSDVAFVGGSLIPRGGHNILEPAIFSKPILSGPHVFNFETIVADFQAENAITLVSDGDALAAALLHFANHPEERQQQGQRAYAVMQAKRGALDRQLDVVKKVIS